MYFLHTPKLVLTGSSPSLRETGDRAAALGAEVVVIDPVSVAGLDTAPAVAELDGFDVAVVAIAGGRSAGDDLGGVADLLGPGLRRGALVIVSSTTSVELDGRRLAHELAVRSGLELGRQFDVVGVEGGDVSWSTGDEGEQVTRFLVTQLGGGTPVSLG